MRKREGRCPVQHPGLAAVSVIRLESGNFARNYFVLGVGPPCRVSGRRPCEVSVSCGFSKKWHPLRQVTSAVLLTFLALPICAYDYPLTSSAIRDAYFLGRRQAGLDEFFATYAHSIPTLSVNKEFVTSVRLETPFLQVVDQVSRRLNYSAQDATRDFYDKPAVFRMYLDICYMLDAPLPKAIKITVLQNDKEIQPDTDERTAFFPATDPYTYMPNVGEKVKLEFDPRKFDSSTLTIRIDTPDDQHAKTEFDLQTLR